MELTREQFRQLEANEKLEEILKNLGFAYSGSLNDGWIEFWFDVSSQEVINYLNFNKREIDSLMKELDYLYDKRYKRYQFAGEIRRDIKCTENELFNKEFNTLIDDYAEEVSKLGNLIHQIKEKIILPQEAERIEEERKGNECFLVAGREMRFLDVKVWAKSKDEAFKKYEEKYNKGEIDFENVWLTEIDGEILEF